MHGLNIISSGLALRRVRPVSSPSCFKGRPRGQPFMWLMLGPPTLGRHGNRVQTSVPLCLIPLHGLFQSRNAEPDWPTLGFLSLGRAPAFRSKTHG